jgi:hypothetical protein
MALPFAGEDDGHVHEVARQQYLEGELRVATSRDPDGNVIGVWRRDPG